MTIEVPEHHRERLLEFMDNAVLEDDFHNSAWFDLLQEAAKTYAEENDMSANGYDLALWYIAQKEEEE